ncbi:Hypothetical protein A7982_01699 [Minicystis rosea]|nr:Hypothetical protein A7982_01699 [Minicystis rosea]
MIGTSRFRYLATPRAVREHSRMGYQGHERRRHKVYITRNTEYHVRDGVCVAVRDRRSRSFRSAHIALNLKLSGGVRLYSNGALIPNEESPEVGDAIFFTMIGTDGDARQIVTSRLEKVDRPPKTDVALYPRAL